MTEQAESKHPCLAGGLIHPDQWQLPETSVRKTLRAGIRDILLQLKADFSRADQAGQSLDELRQSGARFVHFRPDCKGGCLCRDEGGPLIALPWPNSWCPVSVFRMCCE